MATAADNRALDPARRSPGAVSPAGYLARGLSATLILRLAAIGLSFLTMLALSRLLGADGYGQYAYVMATVGILTSLAALGMPAIVVREVAACRAQGDYARLKGVVAFALLVGLAAVAVLALVCWLLHLVAAAWSIGQPAGDHLLLALALLLLYTLGGPLGALRQGLKRIIAAQLPGAIVQPVALLLLLALAWATWRHPLGVDDAVLLLVLAAVIALAVAIVLTRHVWRQAKPPGPTGWRFDPRHWVTAGYSLAILGVLGALNAQADIVLLRWLAGPEATGLFHVATRNAFLLTLLLNALIAPLGPLIAELHAKGDRVALQRVVRRSIRIVFLLTLPAALVMIVAGGFYLELFGAGFAAAHPALAILALAHLVNVGAGPVQTLLIMTGRQRRIIPVMSWTLLAKIALNLALIPRFGATGAACASAFGIVLWNLALGFQVRRELGIDAGVLGPRLSIRNDRARQPDDATPAKGVLR